MEKYEYEEIKKKIIQKRKQGTTDEELTKFLELSGYPLSLLEDARLEELKTMKKTKQYKQEEENNHLIIKVTGMLFVLSALIELFYFFISVSYDVYSLSSNEFIAFSALLLFTLISFSLGFGLYKMKFWAYVPAKILLVLRAILLGILVLMNFTFFVFIIFLDLILAVILFFIKPYFLTTKLKKARNDMMKELKIKNKKEVWEN